MLGSETSEDGEEGIHDQPRKPFVKVNPLVAEETDDERADGED